jgi:hypothetical protein
MSTTPCGQEVERNEPKQKRQGTAADLAGAGRGTRRRRESPERIGLGFRPRARESEEGAAEPGRASSVKPPRWTDWWARAVSPSFYF